MEPIKSFYKGFLVNFPLRLAGRLDRHIMDSTWLHVEFPLRTQLEGIIRAEIEDIYEVVDI